MDTLHRRHLLSTREAVFPARVLSGLSAWAAEKNIPSDKLVPELAEMNPQLRLPYEAIHLGFARAAHFHRSPDLACITGQRKLAPQLGPLRPAQLAQRSLRDAMSYGIEHQLIAGSVLQISMTEEDRIASIDCHRLFEDEDCGPMFDIDHLMAAHNLMSAYCKTFMPLQRLELASTDHRLIEPLQHLLKAPVSLGQRVSRMVFARHWLDQSNGCYDDMTRQFWSDACEKELAQVPRTSSMTIRQLMALPDGGLRSLDGMAGIVGVSVRTLHRLLVREGIDYSAVQDRHRQRRAQTMLVEGRSCESIAEELGFSDDRSFRRAFQRWTGMTPSQYRKRS